MKRTQACAAVVLAVLWTIAARGAYLESDSGDNVSGPPRPEPSVRVMPPPDTGNPLARLVARLEVGQPFSHRGLTVFPLFRRPVSGSLAVITLDEAVRRDRLAVREKGSGEVPFLQVRNEAGDPVLLMAGEVLMGGRQNRLVRDDVLLPARSDFVEVAVYCGEQGRWTADATVPFKSAGSLTSPGLREMAAKSETQDSIWREIDGQLGRASVESSTRSYQALFDDRERQRRLDDYAASLRPSCRGGAVGCVVVSGGRIRGCDVFGDTELFGGLFDKICRSYGAELILNSDIRDWDRESRAADRMPGVSAGEVRSFLDRVQDARVGPRQTPGLGELLSVAGAVSGSALVWRGDIVHAAVFPAEGWVRPPAPRPEPRLPPRGVHPLPGPQPYWW